MVNGLANTINLPVFGNATLASADGATLGGDPFRTSWNQTIAPGQTPAARSRSRVTWDAGRDDRDALVRDGPRAGLRRSDVDRGRRTRALARRVTGPRDHRQDAHPLRTRCGSPVRRWARPRDLGGAHDGAGRTLGEPVEHRLHGCLVALDLGLDRAVGAVAHPSGDAEPVGLQPRGVAEAHALDPAVHDHPPADHPSSVRAAGRSTASDCAPSPASRPCGCPSLRRYRSRTMTGAGTGSEGGATGGGAT